MISPQNFVEEINSYMEELISDKKKDEFMFPFVVFNSNGDLGFAQLQTSEEDFIFKAAVPSMIRDFNIIDLAIGFTAVTKGTNIFIKKENDENDNFINEYFVTLLFTKQGTTVKARKILQLETNASLLSDDDEIGGEFLNIYKYHITDILNALSKTKVISEKYRGFPITALQ